MIDLILLGSDGIKCLKCMLVDRDTIPNSEYPTYLSHGKEYSKADIYILTERLEDKILYKLRSCKRGASCNELAKALGGAGIGPGVGPEFGFFLSKENIIKLDSNRYYILEVNRKIGDLWSYIPLRDCGNLPSRLL